MYSSDIDKRKDRLSKLEAFGEVDSFLLFDEFSTVIYEHSKNYLEGINLQNFMEHQEGFKVSLNDQDSVIRHVFLVEKGIVRCLHQYLILQQNLNESKRSKPIFSTSSLKR